MVIEENNMPIICLRGNLKINQLAKTPQTKARARLIPPTRGIPLPIRKVDFKASFLNRITAKIPVKKLTKNMARQLISIFNID